jgi:hypothetical protein
MRRDPVLDEAHEVYTRACAGPAARYAQMDLERAGNALRQADRLSERNHGSPEANTQAYIALRRAELAEAMAGAQVAYVSRQRSTLAALEAQTERLARVNAELSAALANRRSQTQDQPRSGAAEPIPAGDGAKAQAVVP